MLWVFWCVFFNQCKRRGNKSTPQIGTVKPDAPQAVKKEHCTETAAKSVNQMFLYIFIYFNCWLQSKHNTICCARCAVCQMSELMVRLESSCRQVEQLYYCGPQTRPWLFLGFFFWSLWGNFRNSPSVSFLTLHSRNVLVLNWQGKTKRESWKRNARTLPNSHRFPKDGASRAQAVQANGPKNLHLYGAHTLFPCCLQLLCIFLFTEVREQEPSKLLVV